MLANAKWKLEFAMLLLLTGGRAASFAVPLQATNKQANQIVKEGRQPEPGSLVGAKEEKLYFKLRPVFRPPRLPPDVFVQRAP